MRRPPVVYPDGPYHALLLRHAEREPSRTALQLSGRVVRLGEFAEATARLARGLRGLGLARGERLALYLPNGMEAVLAFLAGSMAGAAVVPINPAYREREVSHLLADSAASILVAGADQWTVASAAWAQCPALRRVVVAGAELDARCVPFATLLTGSGARGADMEAPGPGDLALLPYSSGTSGRPKGVRLTHGNVVATIVQFASALGAGPDDVLVNFLPLAHIYGLMVTGVALATGATLVLRERFDLESTLELVERHRATMLFAVPPVITALGALPVPARHDLSSLRFINTGAASQAPEALARAARATGVPVITGYGLTEAAPVSHSPVPPGHDPAPTLDTRPTTWPGWVGFPVNDTEVRVVDADTGTRTLAPGEAGELLVRGPQVMAGYWEPAGEATEALRDGWLHTGDLATLTADGSIAIVGRKKELIKYKGFSIAPAEIEAVLLEHPAVADCAVVGRPHPEAGEAPVAFVVLRPGAETTAAAIVSFAATRLAGYKRLHGVEVVETIPRSPAGKVLRHLL